MKSSFVVLATAASLLASASSSAGVAAIPSLPGWELYGATADHFTAVRDDKVMFDSKPTARLSSETPPSKFGAIIQTVDADAYRGRRVRFASSARTENVTGWSGLVMEMKVGALNFSSETTEHRALRGTTAWTPLAIVMDVPAGADRITFGFSQDGMGTSWCGKVRFEIVDYRVPLTSNVKLRDADFEAKTLEGWIMDGGGRLDYAATVVSDVRHTGKQSMKLTLAPKGNDASYATAAQAFDAGPYLTKRVRASVWLKSEGVSGRGDFWVRCQGATSPGSGFGLAHGYGTVEPRSDWTQLVAVFDVPKETVRIDFGVGLTGPGILWADDAAFEIVPSNTPLRSGALANKSRAQLRDGDFEAKTLEGWVMDGNGPRDYAATLVSDVRHGGKQSLDLTLAPRGNDMTYGTAVQVFEAGPYLLKRVRASVWLKSEGVSRRGDFWVRCQGASSPTDGPGLAGGYGTVEPRSDWTQFVAVFDVPKETVKIDFGVGLSGPGTLWADDAKFEVVPSNTPLRSGARGDASLERHSRPRNLDFSEGR
jgi:hypothetical protein